MKPDLLTKALLTLIAVFLAMLVLRPVATVRAQEAPALYPFYVEPGTTMLRSPDGTRQVLGKVMVDMSTGDIWGFPTLGGQPYPADSTTTKPPVSPPMYLGRYDLAATRH